MKSCHLCHKEMNFNIGRYRDYEFCSCKCYYSYMEDNGLNKCANCNHTACVQNFEEEYDNNLFCNRDCMNDFKLNRLFNMTNSTLERINKVGQQLTELGEKLYAIEHELKNTQDTVK